MKALQKALANIKPLGIRATMDVVTISKMVDDIHQGVWDMDPKYQRRYKWSPKNKQELITSLLKGIPLPMLYLRQFEVVDKETGERQDRYEVLDGKQRSMTIYNFVKNKFAYCPGNGQTVKFNELPETMKRQILNTNISIRYLNNIDDPTAIDVFVALQNGLRIKTEEVRHALGGSAIEAIKDIYDQTEINKIHAFTRSSDYTKHETIITKWMYLELAMDAIKEGYDETADIVDDNALYNMVRVYTTKQLPIEMKNTIIKRVKSIKFAYKDIKNVLMPQLPMIYGSYLLAARLQDKYGLDEIATGNLIYAFTQYVQDLRVDCVSKSKDWNYKEKYSLKEHQWYRQTMENFGKRGTVKTETHIYTQWFETLWNQFETLYSKDFKKKKKVLSLF